MFDINTLDDVEIVIKDFATINIPIPHKAAIILGDSAVGKTYMCEIIKYAKNHEDEVKSSLPMSSIIVINSISEVDYTITNKLVIIDRFDFLLRSVKHIKEFTNFIDNSNNKFIVISHSECIPCELLDNSPQLKLKVNPNEMTFIAENYGDTVEYWEEIRC